MIQRLAVGPGEAALSVWREGVTAAPVRIGAQHLHRVGAAPRRVGQRLRARGRPGRAHAPVTPAPQRVAAQRSGILPPFPEHRLYVGDARAVDGDLDVMPRRAGTVGGAERAGLLIATMIVVVSAPVAQVDPAHIGHIPLGAVAVAQHHELLLV